jgi:membrane-associated phospholipid phosphatase
LLWPGIVHASDAFSAKEALEDTKQYFTAPLRWDGEDWIYFGATLAAVGVSHEFDTRARTHFAGNTPLNGGQDKNSLRDALPSVAIIAGTAFAAGVARETEGYRETWELLEAGVFSTATGELLSLAAGRERPDATTSPNQWRQGGDAFPSVHVSAAFAIGTVFAESGNDEYRWIRRILGYGVAAGTGYLRMKENVHWLSDTVAGAALGIATARFVLNREEHPNRGSLEFQPMKDGWQIAYSVKTH